ncbi:hypothetical protein QTG95_09280 [Clostridium perfringens]|nr:hypothetical protein [Clostridium perfringens]
MKNNSNKFSVIIIDIIMKDIDGIETSRILRKHGYEGITIFLV